MLLKKRGLKIYVLKKWWLKLQLELQGKVFITIFH